MASPILGFSHLAPAERIELAEQLRDSLEPQSVELTTDQVAELRRRRVALRQVRGPDRRETAARLPFLWAMVLLSPVLSSCRGGSERHADFPALERSWVNAQQRRDSVALDSLLAPEFLLTEGAHGTPLSRDQYIAAVLHTATEDAIRLQDLRAVHHGDSATVVSRFHCTVVRGGQPTVTFQFRTTDLWIHRKGRWLAASRTMVVAPD